MSGRQEGGVWATAEAAPFFRTLHDVLGYEQSKYLQVALD